MNVASASWLPYPSLVPFLAFVEPELASASEELNSSLHGLAEFEFNSDPILTALRRETEGNLQNLIAPTLVREPHKLKQRGHLRGESAEERWHSFVQLFTDPGYLNRLRSSHMMLLERARHRALSLARHYAELSMRLAGDSNRLRMVLGLSLTDQGLEAVEGGLGDSHCGARSPVLLHMSDATTFVYKPRSLTVHKHLLELLDWLSVRGDDLRGSLPQVVDRNSYGWMAGVQHRSCQSYEEVETFYSNLGRILAILWVLGATDLHCGNLIAQSSLPVFVDVETLFHPNVQESTAVSDQVDSVRAGDETLAESVLRTGVLPATASADPALARLDHCAVAKNVSRTHSIVLDHTTLDEPKFVEGYHPVPKGIHNLPRLDDEIIGAEEFTETILRGFSATYRFIMRNGASLCAANGPLESFRGDVTRVVVRNTGVYEKLRSTLYHPSVMNSKAKTREILRQLTLGIRDTPKLSHLVSSEEKALDSGDIPYFSTTTDSTALRDCQGHKLGVRFAVAGLQGARDRIERASEVELRLQLDLMREALSDYPS